MKVDGVTYDGSRNEPVIRGIRCHWEVRWGGIICLSIGSVYDGDTASVDKLLDENGLPVRDNKNRVLYGAEIWGKNRYIKIPFQSHRYGEVKREVERILAQGKIIALDKRKFSGISHDSHNNPKIAGTRYTWQRHVGEGNHHVMTEKNRKTKKAEVRKMTSEDIENFQFEASEKLEIRDEYGKINYIVIVYNQYGDHYAGVSTSIVDAKWMAEKELYERLPVSDYSPYFCRT